jgi:hypothetical protein
MTVTEDGDEDAADCIEVALSFDIPVVEAAGPVDDERILEELGSRVVIDESTVEEAFVAGSEFQNPSRNLNIIC